MLTAGGNKSKARHPLSVCADCGASSPSWASVSRGVLICADCASVHRSLGRHISHVKCLNQGSWIPEQLRMVQSLYSCGANSIWEYSLLNPTSTKGGKRKPQPTDPLHPNKAEPKNILRTAKTRAEQGKKMRPKACLPTVEKKKIPLHRPGTTSPL